MTGKRQELYEVHDLTAEMADLELVQPAEAHALDAELVEAIELPPRYPIAELRIKVGELAARITELETTAERYQAERDAAQALWDAAQPSDIDDEATIDALSKAHTRVHLREKGLIEIRRALAPARYEYDKLNSELSNQENRLTAARVFIERAHAGLASVDQRMDIATFRREYYRMVGRLTAAGEPVEARPIEVGEPHHYAGGNVPAEVIRTIA
jgi:chromosome segregation ATPase